MHIGHDCSCICSRACVVFVRVCVCVCVCVCVFVAVWLERVDLVDLRAGARKNPFPSVSSSFRPLRASLLQRPRESVFSR